LPRIGFSGYTLLLYNRNKKEGNMPGSVDSELSDVFREESPVLRRSLSTTISEEQKNRSDKKENLADKAARLRRTESDLGPVR
jgi:hypothetical protein